VRFNEHSERIGNPAAHGPLIDKRRQPVDVSQSDTAVLSGN